MLILELRRGRRILVGQVWISIANKTPAAVDTVYLAFDGPPDSTIIREELLKRMRAAQAPTP